MYTYEIKFEDLAFFLRHIAVLASGDSVMFKTVRDSLDADAWPELRIMDYATVLQMHGLIGITGASPNVADSKFSFSHKLCVASPLTKQDRREIREVLGMFRANLYTLRRVQTACALDSVCEELEMDVQQTESILKRFRDRGSLFEVDFNKVDLAVAQLKLKKERLTQLPEER